ncbi:hypothetical protein AN639_09785 [Candidatus Epulonipiscium fishelsonii]|uniref:Uncharacterized protein n=1 Tax=Candidatus Epulonipiscium fishelsonii TaxID=77094 RepID=A0ACC8XGB9_9FIRM|nr:hypothetical protein AN639_09785 [Epulopiscium sp. SCG-B05WGA-EpuloA1]ONI42545.1 hypothetical protein AN396_13860 [Epulopiscium sp. SCG-B11WGA-EpuloA1]ONI47002.1 hypothetical protein AN644_02000 [Epulopiscium sp. SCG-C06WGA-EpuloA1]
MSEKNTSTNQMSEATAMVDALATKADVALEKFMSYDQEKIDNIVRAMSLARLTNQMKLARMALEETGRRIFEDKVTKNIFSTEYIYNNIKYVKTVGIIQDNNHGSFIEIA